MRRRKRWRRVRGNNCGLLAVGTGWEWRHGRLCLEAAGQGMEVDRVEDGVRRMVEVGERRRMEVGEQSMPWG